MLRSDWTMTDKVRPLPACWSEFLNGRLMLEIAHITVMFRRGWKRCAVCRARGLSGSDVACNDCVATTPYY